MGSFGRTLASIPIALACLAAALGAAPCRAALPAGFDAPAAGAHLDSLPQTWFDDQGRARSLDSLRGHRVILTMAFATCHRICPMTIDGLKRMQKALDARGERADFVVIGYDPDNDKPADWHRYRLTRHLERSNWLFLSGSTEATETLARRLGFEFWKMEDHVMHGSRALIFDDHGVQQAALGADTRLWPGAL